MRGRRPRALAIVPEDGQPLRRLVRSHGAPGFQVRRALIVLAIASRGRINLARLSGRGDYLSALGA